MRAFGEIGASQKPLTPITLRLKRWSGCRCCLQHEQVGGFGGEGCGGEEGGGGCGDCGGRANSGAGGGGPWSVIASSVLVLPAEDLRSRQLHISTAELVGCCRERLDAPLRPCSLQAPSRLSRVASAIAASVTCGSSKRDGLAVGCSVAGSARVKGVGVEGQDPKTHPPGTHQSLRHSVPAMTQAHMSQDVESRDSRLNRPLRLQFFGARDDHTCRFCKIF